MLDFRSRGLSSRPGWVIVLCSLVIAELAECSPIIIIQNSSSPSSRKNLDVQGATFDMHGQLYCRHANAMALSSSPVVSALGSKSDNPHSSHGQGKALYP